MCWNSEVSMNTFAFSMFVLILMIYNNNYTKYKMPGIGFHEYIFCFSFIIMQLNEFFLWKTVNNAFYNQLFSITGAMILLLQPIASIYLIQNNVTLRNNLLVAYLLGAIPYLMYRLISFKMHTTISPLKHLDWHYFALPPFLLAIWFFFLMSGVLHKKNWILLFFGLFTILVSYYCYNKDGTVSSMWCWSLNSVMIYYAVYLLLYLPFKERMSL